MKAIAWLLTGAASMLAEAIHSLADSTNQVLLLIGGKSAQREATELHPFGYGRDRYITAFLVAIILFSMCGLFACYEAFHKFEEVRAGHPNELLTSRWWWVPIAVLVGAIIAESFSFRTAIKEARPAKGDLSWYRFIRTSRSPELPVILLEDLAALIGLILALGGVGLSLLTGSAIWDAVGSGLIGVLLIAVAIVLAIEIKSLLVGESAEPRSVTAIERALAATTGVERIIEMKTLHVGPEEVLVAAKIAVRPSERAESFAEIVDAAEVAIRRAEPMAGPIYLEPDVIPAGGAAVAKEA
jgi:cation diffusion facilitator family transporter